MLLKSRPLKVGRVGRIPSGFFGGCRCYRKKFDSRRSSTCLTAHKESSESPKCWIIARILWRLLGWGRRRGHCCDGAPGVLLLFGSKEGAALFGRVAERKNHNWTQFKSIRPNLQIRGGGSESIIKRFDPTVNNKRSDVNSQTNKGRCWTMKNKKSKQKRRSGHSAVAAVGGLFRFGGQSVASSGLAALIASSGQEDHSLPLLHTNNHSAALNQSEPSPRIPRRAKDPSGSPSIP